MKKIIILSLLLFLTTGCGTKTMTCTNEREENNMKFNSTYEVQYSGDYVVSVHSVETVTADNTETLEMYKEAVEATYTPYSKIKGYDYTVEIKDNVLTSTVDANYKKIDMDEFKKVDESIEGLLSKNKIKLDLLKATYALTGATCKTEE